jgi:putative membrane protein
MMDWYGGGGSSFAPLMWMMMGLFWIALIALIIFLVIRLLPGSGTAHAASPGPTPAATESPEQILDRLFALGEIDEQTYRTRRTALAEMRRSS